MAEMFVLFSFQDSLLLKKLGQQFYERIFDVFRSADEALLSDMVLRSYEEAAQGYECRSTGSGGQIPIGVRDRRANSGKFAGQRISPRAVITRRSPELNFVSSVCVPGGKMTMVQAIWPSQFAG
jgi:hypothetical protein